MYLGSASIASLTLVVMLLITTISGAQNPWKDVYTENAWEQRDTWQRADDIIEKLNLKPGSKVADIGSHEGYFTMKLAHEVTAEGLVYSVDVSRNKIAKLEEHLSNRKINNVRTIVGEESDPKLPEETLDAVLIVDTYHEMDHYKDVLSHILKSLRPQGRLVLCEPISEERKGMTRDEQERKHELGMNYALEDLQNAGFRIIFQETNFVDRLKEKGDTMWLIVCEKYR